MSTTVDWLHKMREAGLPNEQAEAIASGPEARYVTREYLDARLAQTEARVETQIKQVLNDLTWRMLGMVSLVLVVVGLLDKFVRP